MMNSKTLYKVGLIGTGRISDIYLKNCAEFNNLDIVACGSLNMEESHAKAQQYRIPKVVTPNEIIADPNIDIILNLTIPAAHSDIAIKALDAGKHVYSEKPFVTDLAEGKKILALAHEKNLCVGNAPDTFMGGRWQTARKLCDDNIIGDLIGVSAFVPTHGVERHHPNPDFYYAKGGGPLLDLGPYYLTAMVFLLGPMTKVAGMGKRSFAQRMIENGNRYGEMMPVEVDTHSLSLLEFQNGVIGQMMVSFDVWESETPRLEIYGTEGTICIPDPDPGDGANIFQGEVWYRTRATSRWTMRPRPNAPADWTVAKNTHGLNFDARGIGLADMAQAITDNRKPRASGDMALHICDVMAAIDQSHQQGKFIDINHHCDAPPILPSETSTTLNINMGVI